MAVLRSLKCMPRRKAFLSSSGKNMCTAFIQKSSNHLRKQIKMASQLRKLVRLRLKCDATRAETRFLLSAKRTCPFKSAGASVHSTTGSRCVRISCNNVVYTMFRGSVKGTGYPLLSPVSPSLSLPCVIVFHHVSTGLYQTSSLA